ncbi:hypothetical protein QMT40_000656 [Parvibaculaceae bacterium PLY_AMNH_Bact1]|nr:hypothetical protein QMT40_000656 [Parvibaculaceae bacterium PLY_AMNH_Bact1]
MGYFRDLGLVVGGVWGAVKRPLTEQHAYLVRSAKHHRHPIASVQNILGEGSQSVERATVLFAKGFALNLILSQLIGIALQNGPTDLAYFFYQAIWTLFLWIYLIWFLLFVSLFSGFRVQPTKCISTGATFYGVFYPTLGILPIASFALYATLLKPDLIIWLGPKLRELTSVSPVVQNLSEWSIVAIGVLSILAWVIIFYKWMKQSLQMNGVLIAIAMLLASAASFKTNNVLAELNLYAVYGQTPEQLEWPDFHRR